MYEPETTDHRPCSIRKLRRGLYHTGILRGYLLLVKDIHAGLLTFVIIVTIINTQHVLVMA